MMKTRPLKTTDRPTAKQIHWKISSSYIPSQQCPAQKRTLAASGECTVINIQALVYMMLIVSEASRGNVHNRSISTLAFDRIASSRDLPTTLFQYVYF